MKIYCSGIGGIGLSAYAALQNASGHQVMGSDRADSALLDDLRSQDIDVFLEQDGSHVPEDADLFVYSEAIPEDSPERQKASECGIRQISYFNALGELASEFDQVIAVIGTHGKSSTTAMVANVLIDPARTDNDTTVVVGTKVPHLNGRNWWKGVGKKRFVVEACEYKGSFLHIQPDIVLMTNVDWDHVDVYPTRQAYEEAFVQFLNNLPKETIITTHLQDPDCVRVLEACDVSDDRIIDADDVPVRILSIPGVHMDENARLVYALCTDPICGISKDPKIVSGGLNDYKGTWRRFEEKGETDSGVIVVDDYAHHPKEVLVTIASAHEKYPGRRVVSLFQPHMHDRTITFKDEFATALKGSDVVLVTDVYEARREATKEMVNMNDLVDSIGEHCFYVGNLQSAQEYCSKNLQQNDVLLCMGAGDITNLAEKMIS